MPPTHEPVGEAVIGVIVVNYQSHAMLEQHLAGLASADFVRIIVVDSYSDDVERHAVEELSRKRGWRCVGSTKNLGFAHGVNLGVRRARSLGCVNVLLLNPDAVVSADVLAELNRRVRAAPDRMFAPRIADSSGRTVFDGSQIVMRTGRLQSKEPQATDTAAGGAQPWLTAACAASSLDVLDRVGGLDESYFLYWEDVDLSYRAGAAGIGLVVCDDLVAVHDEGGTQGRSSTGRPSHGCYYRYNARNRLLFAARNLPTSILLRWLVHTPVESAQILLRGGRRQLVQSPWPLAEIIRGSVAGVGIALAELLRRAVRRRQAR